MIAASPMTSNSATGCTSCHTCPRCSDEQWVWVPITGICAERLDIHLGSRMSNSHSQLDGRDDPRHRVELCRRGNPCLHAAKRHLPPPRSARNPPVQAQFKKGQSGNPAGRSRRPRSLTEALLEDFLASWERHGVSVLERVAKRDPAAFITAAVALVPITAPLPLPSPASRSNRAPAPGRRPARRAAGR
jgi:hypothetical protein